MIKIRRAGRSWSGRSGTYFSPRFLYFFVSGDGSGHVQSLVLGWVCLMMGFLGYLTGLVADLIAFNRQFFEIWRRPWRG